MEKPKIGDILYSLNIGNAAWRKEQKLTPVIVKKVGRKYFTAGPEGDYPWMDIQYYLEDWAEKSDYSANSRLFKSEQEWEDLKESTRICRKISKAFEYGNNTGNLSLEDLNKIESIIDSQ